jgi:G:T-mismatch repair DNA endonuclease (very short patch repair protein)
MKRSKLPNVFAKTASKQHKYIGRLLTSNPLFENYEVRQEYPVSWVNTAFPSNKEKFDWVILGLKVVIEVHGVQHYTAVPFGGITMEEARKNYRKQLERDIRKEKAAQDAGWAFVVVKYSEKEITQEELSSRISEALKGVTEDKEDARLHKRAAGAKRQKDKYKRPIPNRPFQKPNKYDWPSKKIPSRPFPKKEK